MNDDSTPNLQALQTQGSALCKCEEWVIDECGYCIDAPHHIPAGAVSPTLWVGLPRE
jgi:hypothetical protein